MATAGADAVRRRCRRGGRRGEVESATAAYSARLEAQGIRPWRIADVVGSAARHRLYRARARSYSLLSGGDRRIAVDLTTT
jgi:hypothetical protein